MKSATRQSYSVDRSAAPIEGVKVGRIACLNEDHTVCVDFAGNTTKNLKARVVKSLAWNSLLNAAQKEQELLLVFEEGNASKPIIIDVLGSQIEDAQSDIPEMIPERSHREELGSASSINELSDKNAEEVEQLQDVSIDGKRISFNAADQIVLKCGKSSITLTRAGKVMIKGAYLLNRSSGALRIKGGSVQIN